MLLTEISRGEYSSQYLVVANFISNIQYRNKHKFLTKKYNITDCCPRPPVSQWVPVSHEQIAIGSVYDKA